MSNRRAGHGGAGRHRRPFPRENRREKPTAPKLKKIHSVFEAESAKAFVPLGYGILDDPTWPDGSDGTEDKPLPSLPERPFYILELVLGATFAETESLRPSGSKVARRVTPRSDYSAKCPASLTDLQLLKDKIDPAVYTVWKCRLQKAPQFSLGTTKVDLDDPSLFVLPAKPEPLKQHITPPNPSSEDQQPHSGDESDHEDSGIQRAGTVDPEAVLRMVDSSLVDDSAHNSSGGSLAGPHGVRGTLGRGNGPPQSAGSLQRPRSGISASGMPIEVPTGPRMASVERGIHPYAGQMRHSNAEPEYYTHPNPYMRQSEPPRQDLWFPREGDFGDSIEFRAGPGNLRQGYGGIPDFKHRMAGRAAPSYGQTELPDERMEIFSHNSHRYPEIPSEDFTPSRHTARYRPGSGPAVPMAVPSAGPNLWAPQSPNARFSTPYDRRSDRWAAANGDMMFSTPSSAQKRARDFDVQMRPGYAAEVPYGMSEEAGPPFGYYRPVKRLASGAGSVPVPSPGPGSGYRKWGADKR